VTVDRLLRLYPRAWRERYGAEFAELVGDRKLSVQQTIDILAGAIDAWTSSSVRAGARGATVGNRTRGDVMIQQLKMRCATTTTRYTVRDGILAALIMIGLSAALTWTGASVREAGLSDLAKAITGISFPLSFTLSMPFWLTKGQSPKAQTVMVGGTAVMLVLIAILSVFI
jgi:hypothetical protein